MSPPGPLTGKYQLVLLGPENEPKVIEHSAKLVGALKVAFQTLGVTFGRFLVQIPSGAATPDLDPRFPSVAVFFGVGSSCILPAADQVRVDRMVADGLLIVPVVSSTATFSTSVPPEIAHLNGISLDDCGAEFERLAARVLEGLGLLRERRRLFISYRRVEASGVASQLYEALDAAGFDVFLDTHGILRPGEPFQEVLWHRLADTDVALLLDTPGFLASRWTSEELARANLSNIQILQLLWPGETEASAAAFSSMYPLAIGDFQTVDVFGPAARLQDTCLSTLVDQIEALRARAVAARHSFLVREFILEAKKAGLAVQSTLDRTLVVSAPSGTTVLVQPVVGVPDAERYELLEKTRLRDAAMGRKYSHAPVVLYDQNGIRTRWIDHLTWLNGNIACARSVSLLGAQKWLGSLNPLVVP